MSASSIQHRRRVPAALFFVVCTTVVTGAPAVQAQGTRLIDREPFDRITLKGGEGDGAGRPQTIEVFPLALSTTPGGRGPRKVPENPKPDDKLRAKLLNQPDKEGAIAWSKIAVDQLGRPRIELFENMVLEQAKQLYARENNYNAAFEYFSYLLNRYPNLPGLEPSVDNFLYLNAVDLIRKNRLHESLAVTESLYERNSRYRYPNGLTVTQVMSGIADRLIGNYIEDKDLKSGQVLLRRLANTYGYDQLPGVAKWRDKLNAQAVQLREQAQKDLDEGRDRQAASAARRMMEVWPEVSGGQAMLDKTASRYTRILVGVQTLSATGNATSLHNWGDRRVGRLVQRRLFEFEGAGATGGKYFCPYGEAIQADDMRGLTIQLHRPSAGKKGRVLTGFDLSRRLRELADPTGEPYDPVLARLLARISVEDVYRVRVELRRPYVLPEAAAQVLVEAHDGTRDSRKTLAAGPFVVSEVNDNFTRFVKNSSYSINRGTPAEILERQYKNLDRAVAALESGDIDVLDFVSPAYLEQLRRRKNITVAQYAHPTLHALIPSYDNNPYLKRKFFRAALAYGIPREAIMNQVVMRGVALPGCRVISGPFPAGTGQADLLAYAYDNSIQPRDYDPRLAFTSFQVAKREITFLANNRGEEPPKLGRLVIGHPADPTIKKACKAIVEQLEKINIKCRLKELPPGQTLDTAGECDLTYVQLAMWEPITDAERVLGPGGLVADSSQHLDQAIRRLTASTNWRDVHENLLDLHQLVHTELPLIPLWQTIDHFAFRNEVRNLSENSVALYQNVDQWQLTTRTP